MNHKHERTVVIMQPCYLPWMGYFEQIARGDMFVLLDTVQFEKQSWQCRNQLKTTNNLPFWLTVPIAAHPLQTAICDILIARDGGRWRMAHLKSITMALSRAPFYEEIIPVFESLLSRDWERLADMNVDGIRRIAHLLGLTPEWKKASELPVGGTKADLVLDICRHFGATCCYVSQGSRYLELQVQEFYEAGVEIVFQTWPHPTYPQRGAGFVSHLSVVDALMNAGPGEVREFIQVRKDSVR